MDSTRTDFLEDGLTSLGELDIEIPASAQRSNGRLGTMRLPTYHCDGGAFGPFWICDWDAMSYKVRH